ncbi:hypothetical protein AM593_07261, partial [Mytilus galloprovincialis]
LMDGLVDVFRAAYVGVGAHPRLLNHAVAEVNSYVKRIYLTVRILFPDLPQNGGPLQIRSEKYVDIDSDDETDGVIALQSTKNRLCLQEVYYILFYSQRFTPLCLTFTPYTMTKWMR